MIAAAPPSTTASNGANHSEYPSEWDLRVDLATAFRWAARLDYHEAVANHFSAAVSEDGRQFLLQRAGQHFSQVCASDLILLDLDNPVSLDAEDAPDPSAWFLHGHLHQALPQARCILHVHAPWSLTLACLVRLCRLAVSFFSTAHAARLLS